jgi:hypothetical protein
MARHIVSQVIVSLDIVSQDIVSLIKDEEHREIYTECITILLRQYPLPVSTKIASTTSLDKIRTFPQLETLAFHLSFQLQALEARGFTLLFWQPTDILVVILSTGQHLYVLAHLAQLVPLNKKDPKQLVLNYPTVFPFPSERCAPELMKMDVLPFITQRSASYYSLALMCLQLLRLQHLSLEKIQGTKLFYFLERCLKEDPAERVLLLYF